MPEIYRTDLPNIMHETIDNEVVVVNLDKGTYYSFDGAGGRIWEWLGEGLSLVGLVAKVAANYSGEREQIAEAVDRFLGQLTAEQLLNVESVDAEPAADDGAAGTDAPAFVEPTVQKYSDMEALLLVDPIHEVDEESGWPQLK
jgi:hypothetical protein